MWLLRRHRDAHDARHARDDLRQDRGCHRLGVRERVALQPQTVDHFLLASNVATRSTERLRERAHEDVDQGRVDPKVVGHTPSVGSHSADGVSLVDEEVELPRHN